MQLFVRHGATSTVDSVHLDAPVADLKRAINAKMGVHRPTATEETLDGVAGSGASSRSRVAALSASQCI